VSEAEIALEAGGGGGGSLSYRIEARRKQQHSYYQRGHRGCWTPEKQKQNTTQDPSIRRAAEDLSLNILHSPVASGGVTTSGPPPQQPQRLLPHVPKRFVVPRVSLATTEFKKEVSFEDENNAVTHLGGEHGGPSCRLASRLLTSKGIIDLVPVVVKQQKKHTLKLHSVGRD